MPTRETQESVTHFKTLLRSEVPQARHGKHKRVISVILSDLDRLKDGSALKVPLAELTEGKAKVRSALNRAARKTGRRVATSSDAEFLYVWNALKEKKA